MALPLKGRPNVDLLHPRMVGRLERFFADPEIRDKGFRISSAVRTKEKQTKLYNSWIRRLTGYNLAANPDRVIGETDEGWVARGSWHMQQEDGWGYAVDISKSWRMLDATRRALFDRVGLKYGLRRTVPSEGWHMQARSTRGWFDDPSETLPPPPTTTEDNMILLHDTQSDTFRVAVPGEGSAVIDSPMHWASVIAAGRKSGVYASAFMDELIGKIRSER